MSDTVSRRRFLAGAAAAAAACSSAPEPAARPGPLATRTLGRTGATPSLLALGCGSRLLSYGDAEKGAATVAAALDAGVTYLDTAQAYGNGTSESWVGMALAGRREGVFLATKTAARAYDDVLARIEQSLERLKTDRVDLLHIHNLKGEDDLAALEEGRAMEALYRVREEGMARFIGITSHTNPQVLATAIERYDIDCTQMALNAALQGMQDGPGKMILNPAIASSFEGVALPAARKKNLGVIAMKVFGQEEILPDPTDKAQVERLLQYSLSIEGVAVAVVGCPKREYLEHNVAAARAFRPMPKAEMERFSNEMSERYKQALDLKFQSHIDV